MEKRPAARKGGTNVQKCCYQDFTRDTPEHLASEETRVRDT